MTQTQYLSMTTLLRRLEGKVDAIEQRLEYVYPTDREMREQISREVDSILSPGGGLKVFADD